MRDPWRCDGGATTRAHAVLVVVLEPDRDDELKTDRAREALCANVGDMRTRSTALALGLTVVAACGTDSQRVSHRSEPAAPPPAISLTFRPPEGARWRFERTGTTRVDGRLVRGVQQGEVATAEGALGLAVRLIHASSTESGTTTTVVPDRTGGEVSFVQRYDARGRMVGRPELQSEPGLSMSTVLERSAPVLATRRVGSAGLVLPEGPFALGDALTTTMELPTGAIFTEAAPVVPARCRARRGERAGLLDVECDVTIDRRVGEGRVSTTIAGTVRIEATILRATGVALRTRERWDGRVSTTLGEHVTEHHKVTDVTTVLEPVAAR